MYHICTVYVFKCSCSPSTRLDNMHMTDQYLDPGVELQAQVSVYVLCLYSITLYILNVYDMYYDKCIMTYMYFV